MMDDTNLDGALAASRPEVQMEPVRVRRAREAALEARGNRHWPRRAALAGIAGGAVLGMGAAAAATVGLPFSHAHGGVNNTQAITNGDNCYQEFWISPNGAADPAAVQEATRALKTLDLSTLDLTKGSDAQRDYQWAGKGPEPDHSYIRESQDTHETVALVMAITNAISSDLTQQGYDATTIGLESEFTCDDMLQD